MIDHTLKMCTPLIVHILWIFSHFWEVLNLDIFLPKYLYGVWFVQSVPPTLFIPLYSSFA